MTVVKDLWWKEGNLTLDKTLDLIFAKLWVFGQFFTEKITVHYRKKGIKKPDITT